jgi:outer membrane surface antigen
MPVMRLWRRSAIILALGLLSGGCSFSYQLPSLFGTDDKGGKSSFALTPTTPKSTVGLPPESDLAFARAAAVEVMTRGAKDASAPWENPESGARGTVTPIASAYDQEGRTCRDFLASYVRRGNEAWLQGEACRAGAGRWEVRSIRPWKRS